MSVVVHRTVVPCKRMALVSSPYNHSVCSARVCVQGAIMRRGRSAGVGATPWVRETVSDTTGGWRPLVVVHGTGSSWEVCGRVVAWRAERRCECQRCGVVHTWTLGLVRRPVALSGMLLRWQSGAFGSCCIESWWIKETILTMPTLRVARS